MIANYKHDGNHKDNEITTSCKLSMLLEARQKPFAKMKVEMWKQKALEQKQKVQSPKKKTKQWKEQIFGGGNDGRVNPISRKKNSNRGWKKKT